MKNYNLICMSFDGDYVLAARHFDSINDAWEYDNDLGSTWYFYPFHFVATHKTIVDAVEPLEWSKRKRIKTVAKIFEEYAGKPACQNMEPEEFAWSLLDNI